MDKNNNIQFKILHSDPLGQGVSKTEDKIVFIAKTLPSETGTAQIFESKKGVHFAKLKVLSEVSPKRIEASCPHFNDCPSCHYLHTDYEYEIELKVENLAKIFSKLFNEKIEIINAQNRLNYRNRIQLHYDLKKKKLGYFNANANEIIEVPNCLISNNLVQSKLQEFYKNNNWLNILPSAAPETGHVEIYDKDGSIAVNWNRAYAFEGFTQVNDEMNQKMQLILKQKIEQLNISNLVELFAGNGNLSNFFLGNKIGFDQYSKAQLHSHQFSLDLYSKKALHLAFLQSQKNQLSQPDLLLLDPPRSGLKNLKEWTDKFRPQNIIYVSCDPHTLKRDVQNINDAYKIKEILLIDLFPSTFHFETVCILGLK
jgi:23S rRNA (uracil1939-C5)-methyltransferase